MPSKNQSREEIAARMRQVDILVAQGQSFADAMRQVGAGRATQYPAIAQPPHGRKIPRKNIRVNGEKFFVRTLKIEDASDRWAAWFMDPEAAHMVNAPLRSWNKSDVIDYIKRFDQRSNLLLGIFQKQARIHVGILTIHIDPTLEEFRVNLLIGEPEYRGKGATSDITLPMRNYLFETLGLKTMKATALARNHVIINYLLTTGWKLEKTLKDHVKSNSDDAMLDLCFFSLSRDAWRTWLKENSARAPA